MTLATIAIPTFNRVSTLPRAVASALAQDYPAVELVICDNGSTDGTEAYCRRLAVGDSRVRYVRQPANIGPLANFETALAAASGEYFMWLADDDWLDDNYLTQCIATIEGGAELAGGRARWVGGGGDERTSEAPIAIVAAGGRRRVKSFYRTVTRNSVFYGVSRTASVRSRGPLLDWTGADWLFVSLFALAGRVETVETTSINRLVGGASDAISGAGWTITSNVVRHILEAPAYACLGRVQRIELAAECGAIVGWRAGVWFPLLALLRRTLGEGRYHRVRSLYRSVGRRRSRSEIVSAETAGHATASAGSSQRTPAEASGT